MGEYVIPLVMCGILLLGLYKNVDVFQVFLEGAGEGLKAAWGILPVFVGFVTAMGMLGASGALDMAVFALGPIAGRLGIPEEVLPWMLLRPVSGGGALALFEDLLAAYGPDSPTGRLISVLDGASETTFYVIAVYFGATKVRKTRHTLPAALAADIAGFAASVLVVRMWLGW